MFTVVCEDSMKIQNFATCVEANYYVNELFQEREFNPNIRDKISIYLIQSKRGRRLLTMDEISALCAFERDEELRDTFEMYAEKMSRPGRVAEQELYHDEEEEQEEAHEEDLEESRFENKEKIADITDRIIAKNKQFRHQYYEEERIRQQAEEEFPLQRQASVIGAPNMLKLYKKFKDEEFADVQQIEKLETPTEKADNDEIKFLNMRIADQSDEIEGLRNELREAHLKVNMLSIDVENEKKKTKKISKLLRDAAMNHILSMDALEFQERLLFGKGPEFKLPKFKRAVEGDEDYKEDRMCMGLRNVSYPRRRLSSAEHNVCNFADANRSFLRYMSEEDFKVACYEDYTPTDTP